MYTHISASCTSVAYLEEILWQDKEIYILECLLMHSL